MLRTRTALAGAIAFLLFGASAARARCFDPLANPVDRDHRNFLDLAGHQQDRAPGVVRFLPHVGGEGPANIDFYFVTFQAPTGVRPEEFFRTIRGSFSSFARGKTAQFAFGPYDESEDANDPVRARNTALWDSSAPLGALMSFNLDSIWPLAGHLGTAQSGSGRLPLIEKAGDVQVVCATPTDFVFATVETEEGDMHPVAGYRGFGLRDDGNGIWTFYSKALDRDSGTWHNDMPGVGDIFCNGHIFWISFFAEFRAFLRARGLGVVTWRLSNHGPVPYPFQQGQQPVSRCEVESPGPHEGRN